MEELFVYALLYSEGFDVWTLYVNTLDRLFMDDPENAEYLSLEGMAPKEAVLHSLFVMHTSEFDIARFGQILMKSLRQVYENIDLIKFGRKMYSLRNKISGGISGDDIEETAHGLE